jgi:hypothetical protein
MLLLASAQECSVGRMKALHFYNGGAFVDMVMAIVKPFLKQKYLNRVWDSVWHISLVLLLLRLILSYKATYNQWVRYRLKILMYPNMNTFINLLKFKCAGLSWEVYIVVYRYTYTTQWKVYIKKFRWSYGLMSTCLTTTQVHRLVRWKPSLVCRLNIPVIAIRRFTLVCIENTEILKWQCSPASEQDEYINKWSAARGVHSIVS